MCSSAEKYAFLLITALAAFAVGACAPAPGVPMEAQSDERLAQWVDSVVVATMVDDRIPGAALVFVRDGEVVLSKGYGVADVSSGRPVTAGGTVWRIGSVTKVLTALALVRLVDRGEVALDAPVGRYVSGVAVTGPGGEPILVRHLLNHSGGFDQVGLRRQVSDPAERPSLAQFAARELRPVRPPGVVGVYDTYGITLAGHLLERVSGMSYSEHLKQHLFEPLGMTRSAVETPPERRAALATGYGIEDGELVPQKYEWYVTLPASSIDATAADMGRLVRALLGDGGGLFSPRMAERVRTERLLTYGDTGAFSWGFWEESRDGYRAIHHGGIMAGFASELYLVPETGVGFFVAYNRDPETGPPPRLREALTDLLYDRILPARQRSDAMPAQAFPVATERFAGAYGGTVACYTCEDGDGWAIPTFGAEPDGPGTLSLYDGSTRLVAIDSTTFVSTGTGNRVRFITDDAGRVRYMVQGPNSFAKLDDVLLDELLGPDWRSGAAHPLVARVRFANRQWRAAAEAYSALAAERPRNGRYVFNGGFALLHAADFGAAEAAFRRALVLGQWRPWSQYYIAAAQAGAGDSAAAWASLDAALDMGFNDVNLMRTEPWWEPYRATTQFRAALARLGGESSVARE